MDWQDDLGANSEHGVGKTEVKSAGGPQGGVQVPAKVLVVAAHDAEVAPQDGQPVSCHALRRQWHLTVSLRFHSVSLPWS